MAQQGVVNLAHSESTQSLVSAVNAKVHNQSTQSLVSALIDRVDTEHTQSSISAMIARVHNELGGVSTNSSSLDVYLGQMPFNAFSDWSSMYELVWKRRHETPIQSFAVYSINEWDEYHGKNMA